jgi:hypothetical protein
LSGVSRARRIRSRKKAEPPDQEAEVVSDGGQDGVDGVVDRTGEISAAHAMLGPEMPNDRLDGGAPSQLSFDLPPDAAAGMSASPPRATKEWTFRNRRSGPILLKKSKMKAPRKSAQIRSTSMIDYSWPRNSIWSDPHRVGVAQ